jgi:hypothetical protein
MKKNDFFERYCIDKDDPTIAGQLGKRYTRLRERGGSVLNISRSPNGGFMREFPMNWNVVFDIKGQRGETVKVVVRNVAGRRNAIAEAVKKLPPDQRRKVSVETARASTF